MKRCEHLSKIGHFGGNCMWSASFSLKSFKCIMAQTFLLRFPCTWFLLFNQYTWFYLLIFSPCCSQNETEQKIFTILSVVQIICILFCSSIYFLQSPKIYVSSLFFSICTALAHWSQAHLAHTLGPEKVT